MFKADGSVLLFTSITLILKVFSSTTSHSTKNILCPQKIVQSSDEYSNIKTDLCTHIIYDSAFLDEKNYTLRFADSWTGFNHRYKKQIAAYKARGVKVLIALSGWTELGEHYSQLVNTNSTRSHFINDTIHFLKEHNLNGLVLAWEYPICLQENCSRGSIDDKPNYGVLVQEASLAFKENGLILAGSVSAEKEYIDQIFDVPILSGCFDWITPRTTNLQGAITSGLGIK